MAKSIRIPLAGLALTTLALAAAAQSSNAQAAQTRDYRIESQPLPGAVNDWADQAGMQVMWSAQMPGAQREAPEVAGRFSAPVALERVLQGSGLTFAFLDERTVSIRLASTATDGAPRSSSKQEGTGGDRMRAVGKGEDQGMKRSTAGADQPSPSQGEGEDSKRETISEVVVTGTRIQGSVSIGSPIRTLGRAEIERSGYTSADQLVQSLPENFRGGAAGATGDARFGRGANRGFNYAFGSGVNLRGLGSTATLVLVNGHRVAPSGSGYFTDISTIPVSAIDHIDILKDGASAIYGSDSIAGVVNIVLKRESDGFDTAARYGQTADGGPSTFTTNGQYGRRWQGGGVTLGVDYFRQGALDVSDRPFTSSIASPTYLIPKSDQLSFSTAAHHGIGDRVEIYGDAQYSETNRQFFGSTSTPPSSSDLDVPRLSGAVGGTYRLSDSWFIRYDSAAGKSTESGVAFTHPAGLPEAFSNEVKEVSRFEEHSLATSGDLFTLPGGPVKIALGASHLRQRFSHLDRNPTGTNRSGAKRTVNAGYTEIQVPIVGQANGVRGLRALTLSAAGRYDDYSDFGSTTNPKYGVSWYPRHDLEIRGAYSESFRAPATGVELVNSDIGTTGVLLSTALNPQRSATIPILYAAGAQSNLQPERARNITIGFKYTPESLEGFAVESNYFDITYAGQLASVAFSQTALSDPALASAITQYSDNAQARAFVNSAIASGAQFIDLTRGAFGPDPLAATSYLFDARIANLSRTSTSGLEMSMSYPLRLGDYRLDTRIDATYITEFSTQLTSTAPTNEVLNTVGWPADLRIRAQIAWTHNALSLALAANHVGSYKDTSTITPRDVGSFDTVDVVGRYDFAHAIALLNDTALTITVTNIFNRSPPYVTSGALSFPGSHYDAANASPYGREISIGFSKHW